MELNALTLRHPWTIIKLAVKKILRGGAPHRPMPEVGGAPELPADGRPLIDARELIARSSIDELNRKAEEYFSHLTDWDYHLAKPFSTAADAPAILINFATMIQGLQVAPGTRVLEFGAGTGWASRYLTQLGCEVVLLDVSKTALEIAAELYRRQPVIGERPQPRFLVFDGRHIDLPDSSVERILCFDAFHHAPNPDEMLREFARVLTPGGIAAFAEPGPHHSKTAQSQFEMRTYGVIESDVDIHAIWSSAQAAGFTDIRLACYNVPSWHVSLAEYDDLLAGGATYLRWSEQTRAFMGQVRNFFLRKAGEEPLDSRRGDGLKATIEATVPERAAAGSPIPVTATITNDGRAVWLPSGHPPGGVSLGCHLYAEDDRLLNFDHHWQSLADPPRRIQPGETVELAFTLPPLEAGRYVIELDCVADRVAWFAQVGSRSVRKTLEIQ